MIDGVQIVKLTTHEDERGFFREVIRFPEQFAEIPVGQLSHSMVKEGVVKAWHGHVYQSQWNYVVSGQIQVALFDNRKESPSHEKLMEFVVGDGEEPTDPVAEEECRTAWLFHGLCPSAGVVRAESGSHPWSAARDRLGQA